jgi:precorrin-2 dehydrogenase/sirohydrochlorin ferrochelatase
MNRDKQGPLYYPISLNLNGRRCVVAGGGQVALRKVKVLLEHKATVEVISPTLCPELQHLAQSGAIKVLQRNYQTGDLKGAFIVIAATGETDINKKIAGEARMQMVLVNVVDDPEQSDFIAPSYLRRGNLTIAVSTAGKSPALARKIRTQLEENFGEEYSSLTNLISEVRSELRQRGVTISSSAWQEALDLESLTEMVRASQTKEAKANLLSRFERLK